jgi:adenylate kinase
MLSLDVKSEELIERLLERGKESGRADDQNKEIISNRINEYNNKTAPLKDYYLAQEKLIIIEGFGTIAEINDKLCRAIDQI